MKLSRRDFIKFSGLTLGALALPKWSKDLLQKPLTFPEADRLGRICAGGEGAHFDLKAEPNINASNTGIVWRDEVVIWKREVVTNQLDYNNYNQKWVETPNGYIYGSYVQPVKNSPNQPLQEFPENSDGKRGMWVEISVPVVDLKPTGANPQYWIRETLRPRIYYSQVFWAYDIRDLDGKWEYLLMQKYGARPDSYWVDATTCRPIETSETEPIHSDVGDKHVKIDLNYRTLSCFEGNREVFFTDVSTGFKVNGQSLTPLGTHTIWRKMVSTHMSSGALIGNFDLPGIGWTTLFDPNGAAIHSVFWHNTFGSDISHGCVNCRPEDAKWIWRWTNPQVAYYPGELTVQGGSRSTKVEVFA